MTSHYEPAPRRRLRLQSSSSIGVLASYARMLLALFLCAGFFILVSPTAQATGGSDVDCVPTSTRECTPQPDREETTTRTEGAPDCEAKTVTITTVTTTTEYTFDEESYEWVPDVTEKTTTATRPVTATECPPPPVTPPIVTPPVETPPVETPPVETPEEETPEEEAPEEEAPEVETPEVETPEVETPPVVVPGDGGGGHQPGTSNHNPGTVVVPMPGTVTVPKTVAAGLGGDAVTAPTSSVTAGSMSLLGGGLVFLVAGLLLSRRKVR